MQVKTIGAYAIYQNREFAFEIHENEYWLVSDDQNDSALGFQPVGLEDPSYQITRLIKKNVSLNDLSLIYEKISYAYYDGLKFQVSRIVDDKIMLNFHDPKLLDRYPDVIRWDRNDYYIYVPLREIEKMEQVWTPYTPPTIRP